MFMGCHLSQNSGWGRWFFWGQKRNLGSMLFSRAHLIGAELYFEVDGVLFCLEQNFSLESIFHLENLESMLKLGVDVETWSRC